MHCRQMWTSHYCLSEKNEKLLWFLKSTFTRIVAVIMYTNISWWRASRNNIRFWFSLKTFQRSFAIIIIVTISFAQWTRTWLRTSIRTFVYDSSQISIEKSSVQKCSHKYIQNIVKEHVPVGDDVVGWSVVGTTVVGMWVFPDSVGRAVVGM